MVGKVSIEQGLNGKTPCSPEVGLGDSFNGVGTSVGRVVRRLARAFCHGAAFGGKWVRGPDQGVPGRGQRLDELLLLARHPNFASVLNVQPAVVQANSKLRDEILEAETTG